MYDERINNGLPQSVRNALPGVQLCVVCRKLKGSHGCCNEQDARAVREAVRLEHDRRRPGDALLWLGIVAVFFAGLGCGLFLRGLAP
jgi:hypothetical protein